MTLLAQPRRGGGIGFARRNQLGVQLRDPLSAGLNRSQLLAHVRAKGRKLVSLDAMLAGKAADVEQPRFGRLKPGRVERHCVGRTGNLVLGLARLDQAPGREPRVPRQARG